MLKEILYDIGVYPLYFAIAMFGEPEEYFGYNYILESGVDGCGSILLKYGDKIGNISYSKITDERSQSEILGEKGSIVIDKVSQVKGLKIKYSLSIVFCYCNVWRARGVFWI